MALAAVTGAVAGGLVVRQEIRQRRDPEAARRWLSRFPYFEALLAIAGLALVLLGIIVGSLDVALSGLPFLAMALVFLAVKQALRRRRGGS